MPTRIDNEDSYIQWPYASYLSYSTPFEYLVLKMLGDDFFEDLTTGTNTYATAKDFYTMQYNIL